MFVYQIDREGAINWVLSLKAHVKNESDLINGMRRLVKKHMALSIASTANVYCNV